MICETYNLACYNKLVVFDEYNTSRVKYTTNYRDCTPSEQTIPSHIKHKMFKHGQKQFHQTLCLPYQ